MGLHVGVFPRGYSWDRAEKMKMAGRDSLRFVQNEASFAKIEVFRGRGYNSMIHEQGFQNLSVLGA